MKKFDAKIKELYYFLSASLREVKPNKKMNVEKHNEDQEIENRDLNEEVNLMSREDDDDFEMLNRNYDFEEDAESDDYDEDSYEEEDDDGLGMYFDGPPQPYQGWKKPKRKRSRRSSYSGQRFRWDDDEEDDW